MKKLLAVIDYQNDFVNGSLGFELAVSLEENICKKITQYKNMGLDVLFTFDTHFSDYLSTQEGKNLPVEHCIENSHGYQLYGKVASLFDPECDISFQKHSFGSLDFANFLKSHPYDEIEFVGVVSNICVLSNVILAKSALPEATIYVDSSATASNDPALNDKALDILRALQVVVI